MLAFGAAAAVITLAVGAVVLNGPVSTEEATLLSTALGAIIGAVATYLGTRGGTEPARPEPVEESPPPGPPGE